MPLKAIVDGVTVIAPDLTGEEWEDLARRHRSGIPVTMACCGAPGHPRKSRRGTQHFYHASAAGCTCDGESQEHMEIKYLIYRACQARGWATQAEFMAPDRSWVADVYAEKDGKRIVFEVQLSTISPAELEDRDAKYRMAEIASYWLLDDFPGLKKDFAEGYHARIAGMIGRDLKTIPWLDSALFATGPENQVFCAKGIRTVGLYAKTPAVFTTNNPEIPVTIWVREVLNGNYQRHLDETAAAVDRTCRLVAAAAPALVRLRGFYHTIVRDRTYRERFRRCTCGAGPGNPVVNHGADQRPGEIARELEWLENEYRSCMAESTGLFSWEKMPGKRVARPVFRPETEANVRRLQEYAERFGRWEAAFDAAVTELEQ